MGVRAEVAAALEAELTGVQVVGYADAITPDPSEPVVVVGLRNVAPGAASGRRTVDLELICAVAKQRPGTADDDLEDLLGDVLNVLDGYPWARWTAAERSVYLESFPAFTVTLSI